MDDNMRTVIVVVIIAAVFIIACFMRDNIIPVSKGGITEESNLQTLCWKCNRSKADKVINMWT